ATGQDAGIDCALRYGYSHDSLRADSFVAFSDPIKSTAWIKDTFNITPKKAAQYVWIEVSVLGGDEYTIHVDVANMLNLPTTGVRYVATGKGISVWPNPVGDNAMLQLVGQVATACTVAVYD